FHSLCRRWESRQFKMNLICLGASLLLMTIASKYANGASFDADVRSSPSHKSQFNSIVSGKVTDTAGEPIPGVTVSVEGSTIGTVTALDGNYSLNAPENTILVFSFIGYQTQKIQVAGQSIINVTFVEEISSMDEFVVVGYGTQSKRNVTSAIGSVTSEEIDNYPVQQVGQALQG